MQKRRFLFVILAMLGCITADGWQTKQPDVIFVPTPKQVVEEMLRVADIREDDLVYDLGSGDGRIIILAAQKNGLPGGRDRQQTPT